MSLRKLLDHNGFVKLAPKVGDGEPIKPVNKKKQATIDFCLNCKRPTCLHGTCPDRQRNKGKRRKKTNDTV